MNQTSLYMTEIRCQKMLHRVGESTLSPYQVTVSRGPRLGVAGHVISPEISGAANLPVKSPFARSDRSWLIRRWQRLFN